MNSMETLQPILDRAGKRSLVLGLIALAICVGGAMSSPSQFLRSYLVAYLFWLGLTLGCLAIVMLHHLVGGNWGHVIRRALESGTRTLPLMLALILPLLWGMPRLYSWAGAATGAMDRGSRFQRLYLSPPLFIARAAIYFAVWIIMAYLLNRWSSEHDRTAQQGLMDRLRSLSGPGLVLYGLTVTFAVIDWAISLEAPWFSTIYGMIFIVIQALAAMSFVIVVTMFLAKRKPLAGVISPAHFHDLGNLLLTFVMLWGYLSFSQFLIIWSGNLPEEIPWYVKRGTGEWGGLALFLIIFHFAVPFVLLLSRSVKRKAGSLAAVAAALIVVSLVDVFWMVTPAFEPARPRVHWMDVLAPVGIGGIWVAWFLRQLRSRPLLPLHDPRFEVVPAHGD
jgi:hypothetical protein